MADLPLRALLIVAVFGWTAGAPGAQQARSGLDVGGFDRSVLPEDDLYRYVNGGWLARTAMPADRVSHGAFTELADRSESDLRTIVEELAARPARARGSDAQQIVDLYASVMDVERLDRLGVAPIASELHKIDAIGSRKDLAAEAGYLSSIAAGGPFDGTMGLDPAHPGAPVVRVMQGGILLPPEYYLKDEPIFVGIRARYERYLTTIFELAARAAPAADAHAVVALETALARARWPEADSRNLASTYNRYTLSQLASEMPGFDWAAWARPQGIDRSPDVILAQPSFFTTFAAMVPTVPLATWRAWLAARFITASAPYISTPFDTARFEFFGTILTGQELPRTRWKRGISLVNAYLGDALGRLYVEEHFPPRARTRVQTIVEGVVHAYREAFRNSDWISPRAKREALAKLTTLSIDVGYPQRWRSYRGLVIRPDDLLGNVRRAVAFEAGYSVNHMDDTAGEWVQPPQTVNASYSPAGNTMALPAAILQPPIFDVDADEAVNYGGAGALIGHEIGHAFDEQGHRFDAKGAVHDWWTPADAERFRERTRRLEAQLNAYEPLPGMHVDGTLTLGESVGDLEGLSIAYRAYQLSLDGRPSPVIDGLTGEQRFFMGWAQIRRSKDRDEYLRQTLRNAFYLPAAYRAHAALGNVDGFYEAFGVTPANRLYRPPAERVKIWRSLTLPR